MHVTAPFGRGLGPVLLVLAAAALWSRDAEATWIIDFETAPDGGAPVDNAELDAPYVLGGTSVTLGIDTGTTDGIIDRNAHFEQRGNDLAQAYLTDDPELGPSQGTDDADKTATGSGGDWILRPPSPGHPPEAPPFNRLEDALLIVFSGTLPSAVSFELWDLDGGEQFEVEALQPGGASHLITVGPLSADGLPTEVSFSNLTGLTGPIEKIRIQFTELGSGGGYGLDNVTVIPEPTTALLVACGLVGLAVRGRRAG